jgi:hypothetical protein
MRRAGRPVDQLHGLLAREQGGCQGCGIDISIDGQVVTTWCFNYRMSWQ